VFQIVNDRIEPAELRNASAGGFVTFEGRVRDHNEGRSVVAIEYEAFVEMAEPQGELILAEALLRFDILEARAIHRVGRLEIGDVAVWICAGAVHRRDAFQACEWIIDQIKEQVPIWKKEHYADGDSGWVGVASLEPDVG
jgi:molybdopterin synthase catalytic subunit